MNSWNIYIIPDIDVKTSDFKATTISELEQSKYSPIPAKVPGNFELDMLSANLIEDPYYGINTLEMQALENRHLWYTTVFDGIEINKSKEDVFLYFNGIDTVSEIYLNGKLLGHTENMLISYDYNVGNCLKEKENALVVHIYPSTLYSRRFELTPLNYAMRYTYDSLSIRKAASMFGWDIMPRIVSGGIWKSVKLITKPKERIEDIYVYTAAIDSDKNTARVNAFYSIHTEADLLTGMRITLHGKCEDSEFEVCHKLFHIYGTMPFEVHRCKLWWPKNSGNPYLYDVTVKLWRDHILLDEKKIRIGIRTVELERTSTTDIEGNGDFCFKINKKRIFILGTNWVPLDAFHSNDINRLPKALELLDDIGCNAVRCWGGNVYENDEFFDFCDEKGIMVWQDFAMGCGVYPQDDRFLELIREEAVHIIKKLRNHCSIVLWAGDNECDVFHSNHGIRCNPNQNKITRDILSEMVRMHDFVRPYLPSSPYVDEEAFSSGKAIPENHLWGPRDYFKSDFYKNSVCHFASEIGYHGCPSPESLKKYIPEEKLWPMFDNNGHTVKEWQVHAACMETEPDVEFSYRISLMARQVVTLFGKLPDNIYDFAKLSQISQAEANKYFIEHFRLSKWRRTGIIWWNLIDGWPQISDAAVDYFYSKKLAYHYIKRAQNPVCLMFDEPINDMISLYAVNDTPKAYTLRYTVTKFSCGASVLKGTVNAAADSSLKIGELSIAPDEKEFYFIEWEDESGSRSFNHYFTNIVGIDDVMYADAMNHYGMNQYEGF